MGSTVYVTLDIDGEREEAEGNDAWEARDYLLREIQAGTKFTLAGAGVAFRVQLEIEEA